MFMGFPALESIFLDAQMRNIESVLPSNVSARVAVEAGIAGLLVQICYLKGAIVG